MIDRYEFFLVTGGIFEYLSLEEGTKTELQREITGCLQIVCRLLVDYFQMYRRLTAGYRHVLGCLQVKINARLTTDQPLDGRTDRRTGRRTVRRMDQTSDGQTFIQRYFDASKKCRSVKASSYVLQFASLTSIFCSFQSFFLFALKLKVKGKKN